MSSWASTLGSLLQKTESAHTFHRERVQAAYDLAEEVYADRLHGSGVPLLEHVLRVLDLLLPFQPDEDTVIACLLQHVLQQKKMTLVELEERFGRNVRSMVSGVHLLSHVSMRTRRSSIEDLRLMLLSVSEDMRVILIILCDRCHVLERLPSFSAADRKRIAREVLNLFAPVAARLGIHTLKQRLEGFAFPVVYTSDSDAIAEQLHHAHVVYGSFLLPAAEQLTAALAEQGITANVEGREKHPYSIFLKLKAKGASNVLSLPDLFALRVLVETEEDCYRVLGMLHRLGHPVANRFKDYIAFPKPNGYQSLHTTLTKLPGVPEGIFMEVQVRTQRMHREAEYGIAAHWSYKEGGTAAQAIHRIQLQQMLTSQQAVEADGHAEVLADHIFVLTPKGDIVELPEGATPLDFAFQIHTDLGIGFRAARVNGAIVPLDYELENGDIVEIQSHRVPQPSTEWLQLLRMASSRSRLKRYLYSLDRTSHVSRGKELLNEELAKHRLRPLDTTLTILRDFDGKSLTMEEREDVLLKIGQGAEKPSAVLPHLTRIAASVRATQPKRHVRLQRKDSIIEIEGGMPMPMRFAKCCKPNEGDREKIHGSITRGGEVVVHRARCHMMKNANPERRIGVKWLSKK